MLSTANLLVSSEKTKSKPGETITKIYNKPRLTKITQVFMQQEHIDNILRYKKTVQT